MDQGSILLHLVGIGGYPRGPGRFLNGSKFPLEIIVNGKEFVQLGVVDKHSTANPITNRLS
jgi:hypothetical protein